MDFDVARAGLIHQLDAEIEDKLVLSAMSRVPRELFIPPELAHSAYDNIPLPIGLNQTISQPYIVARMIEILRNGRQLNKVLEVVAGCGYQAAVLGQVANEVYSVERIQPLFKRATNCLKEIKAGNVILSYADGTMGRPEIAPFDGIIMAAAATHVPQALLEQLAVGGRMVLPLGVQEQFLTLIERDAKGYRESRLEPVKFVPILTGKA